MHRWASRRGAFPEAGYVQYGYSLFAAKEYYAPKGQIGWFFFGRGVEWRVDPAFRSAITGPQAISLPDSQSILPHPQSLQGGLGIVFRRVWGRWACTVPVDLHIMSVAYAPYEEFSSGGETLRIRIASNSFLGTGVGFTLQRRLSAEGVDTWGIGLYLPFQWGVPSVFTKVYTAPNGSQHRQASSYYLKPSHFSVRLFIAVVP